MSTTPQLNEFVKRFLFSEPLVPTFPVQPQPESKHRKARRADRESVEQRLLSTREGARYLNISEWKLRAMVHSGEIEYVPGKYWRFDKQALDRWIVMNRERRNA